MGSRVC